LPTCLDLGLACIAHFIGKGRIPRLRSAQRAELKLNSIFSGQFDEERQFRLSFFEFFSASRKETIKTARHTYHGYRKVLLPDHSWRMGNSSGKIDNVTLSATEQLSGKIYLDFTGFNQKRFIGRAMKVRRRNVGGRSGNPQHAEGVTRLLGTNQNMCSLTKRSDHAVVVDFSGSNIHCHRLTNAHADWLQKFLLALFGKRQRDFPA
jgi:hypothetical protein